MTLEIQAYLRSGKTLSELQAEYGVRSRVSETLGVASLNYNQTASPMQERLCQECRALILDTRDWGVASRSFFKFFNYGEPFAHEIDWATAKVLEKIDGSLICFYFHAGEWRVATKGTPDASGTVNGLSATFRDLVLQTLREMDAPYEDFVMSLDPSVCYSFELTAPENRVIVPYEKRQLTWLAAWDRETLDEIEISVLPDLATPRVREYPITTLPELLEAVQRMEPLSGEGYIVRDAQFQRLKVKSPSYLMIDRILCGLTTPRRKVETVFSEQFDDILAMLPEQARQDLLGIKSEIARLRDTVRETHQSLAHLTERKEFAAAALAYPYSALLFRMYGGMDVDDALRTLHSEKLAGWLNLQESATQVLE